MSDTRSLTIIALGDMQHSLDSLRDSKDSMNRLCDSLTADHDTLDIYHARLIRDQVAEMVKYIEGAHRYIEKTFGG